MRRSGVAIASLAASGALIGCAAEPRPLAPPPTVEVAQATPAPPPAPPAMMTIANAEASPRETAARPKRPDVAPLRSDGMRYALERTEDGVAVFSEDRGVVGFLTSPVAGAEIRWAGFAEDDAVLIATRDTLHRADTPDDAIAGKLTPLDKIDPTATMLASAGKIVVAASPIEQGVFYLSRDGGRHFAAAARPARGPIVDVAVRSDGVVVAAVETGKPINANGRTGVRADVFVSRAGSAWTKGPSAVTFYGSVLWKHGDTIAIQVPKKKNVDDRDTVGLSAKSTWIPTDYPDPWLDFAAYGTSFWIGVPWERPGFAKRPGSEGFGVIGGVGRGGGCHGAACLGHRHILASTPHVSAFRDGVCAKDQVRARTEPIDIATTLGKLKHEVATHRECDENAPAQRAASLLVRTDGAPRVVRLPAACAQGHLLAGGRATFVACSSEHRGRSALLHLTDAGTLTEVAAPLVGNVESLTAESASDGTTAILGDKGAWICSPACTPLARDRLLAARPLPGGRALVARQGARDAELTLEVFGGGHDAADAPPVRVAVTDNVLEMEVTAEGSVRLWTSRSRTWFGSIVRASDTKDLDAFLVRSDGQLIADPAARETLLAKP